VRARDAKWRCVVSAERAVNVHIGSGGDRCSCHAERPARSDQAAIDEIRHAWSMAKVVEALVRSVTERSSRAGHLELLTA
jgi:hypothetical protein